MAIVLAIIYKKLNSTISKKFLNNLDQNYFSINLRAEALLMLLNRYITKEYQ